MKPECERHIAEIGRLDLKVAWLEARCEELTKRRRNLVRRGNAWWGGDSLFFALVAGELLSSGSWAIVLAIPFAGLAVVRYKRELHDASEEP